MNTTLECAGEQVGNTNSSQIAFSNDVFRRQGFGVMVTRGIQDLGDEAVGVLRAVREFNAFTGDNDPYGEHDFGSFSWKDEKIFWKIDYYDESLERWEDPLSSTCRRVLTVMLADEY